MNQVMENNESLSGLIDRAIELYEQRARYDIYHQIFTLVELIALWGACCKDFSLPFDDEVYDALNVGYGYFEKATV